TRHSLFAIRLFPTRLLLLTAFNHALAAHIRPQRVGHRNRSALLLIGLHHGNQRTADRDAGAVERVHEAHAVFPVAEAGVHAPRLEVTAVRARGDLAVHPLPRQPYLDVVGFL